MHKLNSKVDVLQRCSVASLQELCLHGEWVEGGGRVGIQYTWRIFLWNNNNSRIRKYTVFLPFLTFSFRQRGFRGGRMSTSEWKATYHNLAQPRHWQPKRPKLSDQTSIMKNQMNLFFRNLTHHEDHSVVRFFPRFSENSIIFPISRLNVKPSQAFDESGEGVPRIEHLQVPQTAYNNWMMCQQFMITV